MPPIPEEGPVVSLVERLPGKLFYAPLVPYWAWLSIRYGGLTSAVNANPGILTGGFSNESKSDVLSLLGEAGRARLARYAAVDVRHDETDLPRAKEATNAAGIPYPLVVKPDIGRNGRGVNVVHDDAALAAYLRAYPKGEKVMLQEFVDLPGEAGVFYVRRPDDARGRITSLTLKYFPQLVGDGRSSVRELILRDRRAGRFAHIYLPRHARELDRVIPEGTPYRLASIGNHARGAVFVDGAPYVTDAMTDAFDAIAKEMDGFFFGRFDVRFPALADLAAGVNFSILEVNGAGSEPTHVYDRRISLARAWRDTAAHWRMAFAIGADNRARGAKRMSSIELFSHFLAEKKRLSKYRDEE